MAVLISTKLNIPLPPAGFVARPPLTKKLEAALACRLTLVSAPAGAGKTTLASTWALSTRQQGIHVGWLSLDANDNDPRRFFSYLEACVEEEGIAMPEITLPQDGSLPPPEDLLAAFFQPGPSFERPAVLILDDYHIIQNPAIHATLEYFIEHLPQHIHLLLLTRSDPPLPLARWRVAAQLLEVRMEQLRFSAQEAAAFLKKATNASLTEADILALNTRTEGWIAGLQMAAISLRGHQNPAAFIAAFAGSHRFVFDYLLEEVLNRQSPEVRLFLLHTSVLERLSASLCEAVAQTNGTAHHLLDTLERENLFLICLDEGEGSASPRWYRYHHLFADLLQLLLEHTSPGQAAELHRRAARWYEAQELLPEALHHALAAGDMELAASLVSANVLVLIEQEEAISTLQKIDAVPISTLNALPWLGIARSWVIGAGQVQKSQQILDNVEKSLESIPSAAERQRLQGHLAASRAWLYSAQGDIANTIRQARLAEELLPAEEIGIRALNLAGWGDTLVKERPDPHAIPILEQALDLARQAQKPYVTLVAAAALTSAHLGEGRLRQAYQIGQQALELAESYLQRTHQRLAAATMTYVMMARICLEWGETERAIQLARRGVAQSEYSGQEDIEEIGLSYLGQALMFSGDSLQAMRIFQRALAIARKISPWLWQMVASFALDSMLDCERVEEADLQEQITLVQESGGEYYAHLKARLLLRAGQPERALAAIDDEMATLGGQPSLSVVRLLASRALAYQAQGNKKKAIDTLEEVLDLAEPENRILSLACEGEPMVKLLRLAIRGSNHPDFIRRVLGVYEERHKSAPTPFFEALIEPLSEREVEILRRLDSPLATPEIAELLVISSNTIRTHIKNIYAKLGVHGRSAAVRRGREIGLIQ